MSATIETVEQRVERLMRQPGTATVEDINWMAHRVQYLEGCVVRGSVALRDALKQGGFIKGLLTAADLIEAASRKSVQIRTTLVGAYTKKQQVHRAVNEKMLLNVASLVRRFAADAESGKLDAMEAEAARKKREAEPGSARADPEIPGDTPPAPPEGPTAPKPEGP